VVSTGRPWRVPARDAAAEIKDFATAPGFHPTLYATTGSHAPTGLSEIRAPVRICFGIEDAMLGALTAPRFAAAIPGAQLIPLPGCGHVPMADNPDLVAKATSDLTLVCRPPRAGWSRRTVEGGVAFFLLLILLVIAVGVGIALYTTGGALLGKSDREAADSRRATARPHAFSTTEAKVRFAGTGDDADEHRST
jgi:hypothetical protein